MCLQVMGNIEPAAKVVMWTETRQPIQTWAAKMRGLITSLTFPGMVLDIKGMKNLDEYLICHFFKKGKQSFEMKFPFRVGI